MALIPLDLPREEIPAALIEAWGPDGLQEMLDSGYLVRHAEPEIAEPSRTTDQGNANGPAAPLPVRNSTSVQPIPQRGTCWLCEKPKYVIPDPQQPGRFVCERCDRKYR